MACNKPFTGKIFLIILLLFSAFTAHAQVSPAKCTAFCRGEHLRYHINFYSFITGQVKAGVFELLVEKEPVTINNRLTYHCVARGHTQWAFDFFYKVNDRFESYIDESSLIPLLALRRIRETDFIRNEDLVFNHTERKATFKNNVKGTTRLLKTYPGTMDILTAVYYLRNIDPPGINKTGNKQISYIFADSLHFSNIKFLGIETLETSFGKVNCYKVQPEVLKGSVFKTSYPLTIWVSNDKNRIPVKVESEIVLGKVSVDLVSWAGLLNPFAALKTGK